LSDELPAPPGKGIVGRAARYPRFAAVTELVEASAAARPDAPAVTYGSFSVTYAQLNGAADRLAGQLAAMTVGRGDFVPLVMRNGPELPVAMLAAMKLAAPFVPVDDTAPGPVQARMISALRPKVVLRSAAVDAPVPVPGITVDLAALLAADAAPDGPCPGAGRGPASPGPGDIAYGFYTTGSTGTPKCALNVHRGLLNRFLYMSRRFGGNGDEVVLQNSRHVFDSSLWQLLWPLTNGSQVVIPDRAGILDLQATADIIERHRVTMTDFVPSIFNTLVAMMSARPELAAQLTSLRRILIGGEEATTDTVQEFRAMLPHVAVINTYGPTEASIGSVFHEVADSDTGGIPIGLPIDNTYAVIVDDQLDPVEPGEVGEILLGGECLGLGYLGDAGRTALAFIANPFPGIPGSRLYRTGDLGRYLPDGLLGFAGRTDQQVKIAGVRVELPEIELALLRHPLVREAKVIVRDEPDGKWLVAFVTGVTALDQADLRAHASGELSPSLVPKEFVVLDRMPLNANGKADRRALARLAERDRGAQAADRLSETEQLVWQAWRQLLPVPPSSVTDDFFDLGGDSLSAQRLALLLTRGLGSTVTVGDIADRTTIAAQASLSGGAPAASEAAHARARMDQDAALPADITPGPPAPWALRQVLLTGSTGFVGAHLLHELLSLTPAEVFCLVRADSEAAALDRVKSNLCRYRLWQPGFAGRIHALAGDLRQPRLGLDNATYQRLCRDIDTVLHNAAVVNLVSGYAAHRAANVVGTVEILRFAATARAKPVHYVSTLAAVVDRSSVPAMAAAEAPPPPRAPEGGYSQSKWVAERLLGEAAERGITVTVYRLGEMMPHSVTGVPSRRGLPDLLAKACLRVGLCFTSPVVMNYTPIDYASRLVVTAVAQGETGYFHIRHPQAVPFDDLAAVLGREFGLPAASYRQFWTALCALADARADEEILGTLALVPRADEGTDADVLARLADLFGDDLALSSTLRTDRLMAEAGMNWPPLGDEIFGRYVAYHRESALTRDSVPPGSYGVRAR
jgi:amino acid adenylation domain-containing protein/thioester reductase-like protein